MKRVVFSLIILIGFTACETPSDRETVASTDRHELDSLKKEKAQLQREIEGLEAKTTEKTEGVERPVSKEPVKEELSVPEKPIKEPIEQPILKADPDKGAIHYFNGTKKVAVRITPWKDNHREVICYAKNGEVTYSFEDVRLSHTVFTDVVSFHENGAANRIHVSDNPGGSLYYYETNYTFDEENYPVEKESIEYPQTLEKMLDNVRHWDREKRVWE
ncbi:MAG: hypothetical protein A3D31_13445 [Candidatus Fluviicola riflensis]|nr:MAG: hypothetical protein CHH17_17880 [Candidatus Fluviicola riflensis]OGS77983.1 MAG: hypothetical protein A3D31_13445 [Candidatus Fluviicola riflensis]OGS85048.1 MAG: hypothetical protein A2724_10380 [Fluviicola sp. RIFCSPHIGHO2_01_FULL_43_53]OGS89320.1 MAG: hypothetical protein A3E30_04685 [Fluviicola sp. RIFCSPHIGHO2_12_FULL_43_24]